MTDGLFRQFFERRNGRPWPKIGEAQPYPLTWDAIILDTAADYFDAVGAALPADVAQRVLERASPSPLTGNGASA